MKRKERKRTANPSDTHQTENSRYMLLDGHKVTLSFSTEPNEELSSLVRNTLLDSYIRNNGTAPFESPTEELDDDMDEEECEHQLAM